MQQETITREVILTELERAESQLEILENKIEKLREKLARTDDKGVGVLVSYDYDYKWIVETLNDGEWEMDNPFNGFSEFSEAVQAGEELAKKLGCGIQIDPYKPPKKYCY